MSVFPDSETFDRDEPALGVPAPSHVEPHVARVTLNPRVVGAARDVVVVVHGAGKAEIVATVMGSERDERRWPAQLALRDGATWILDEAAAAALTHVTGASSATAPEGIAIRRASALDAGAVADVYLAAFMATYTFPLAHSDEDVRRWLAGIVANGDATWVAEEGERVVAMMVLDDAGIDQLYVDPGWHGRGIGSRLVAVAKHERPAGLSLYTFQVNERARRFYERQGFVVAALGDGSGNEEHQPDVRYEWHP